jgi:hypothetical protein
MRLLTGIRQICIGLSDLGGSGLSLHAHNEMGVTMRRGVQFLPEADDSKGDPREELRERFREAVMSGRYDALLDSSMRAILREGAAIRGVDEELGAIRFALAKLLAEESDASKLASGVARLTSASVQAMKMGQSISDETDESLADLLNEILIDLEKKSQVARAARREGGDDRAWRQDTELAGA